MILPSSGHVLPPNEVGFVLLLNELFKIVSFQSFWILEWQTGVVKLCLPSVED